MKYVPESPSVTVPNGMLRRRMSISSPSSSITVNALCALVGFTSSSSSMSESFSRPMIRSCSSVETAFHLSSSCTYFCTST